MRANRFNIYLFACWLASVMTLMTVVACDIQRSNTAHHPYVDLPEELPSAGDMLMVYKCSGDTLYLGYIAKD